MNSESFEQNLEALDQKNASSPEVQELQELRDQLRLLGQEEERSDQHQQWAWTRLQAELKDQESRKTFIWDWKWGVSFAALGLLTFLLLTSAPSSIESETPIVNSSKPTIYTSSFHSPEAKADVIWVEGYRYLPASYNVNQ